MATSIDLAESRSRAPGMPPDTSHRYFWHYAIITAFPSLVILGLGVNLVTPMNGVDEFIYVGAVDRFRDYLLRWPETYYAVRFGYIFPEWLFERVFGNHVGYAFLRFSLLGMIAAGCRANRRLSLGPALLGALVVVSSPVILVTLFNKYVMSLSLAFLLLGASLLSNCWAGRRRAPMTAVCAGMALALSWNSHLVSLPICLVIAAVFSIDGLVEARAFGAKKQLQLIACVGFGTAITVAAGILIYRWQFGVTDLYGPTLHQATQETNQVFIDKTSTWITWRHYLLIGPLGICAGIAAWRATCDTDIRRSIRRLTLMTALSFVVFAWFEWVRRDPLLSTFIYSCMPLGLALLTLARSVSSLADEETFRYRRWLAVAAVLSIAVMGILDTVKPGFEVLVALGMISIVSLVHFRRSPSERFLATYSVVLVASFASVSSPHDFPAASPQYRVDPFYDNSLFTYDWSGFDQLDIADQFARSLPSLPADRGEIRIWFDSTGEMNQIISTLVWYRSALQIIGDPPMPQVSDSVRQRIGVDRPRWVVILDNDSSDVNAGIAKVQALRPYHLEWKKEMRSGSDVAFVALLQITDSSWSDFPCYNQFNQSILCSHVIPVTWSADLLPTAIGLRSNGRLIAKGGSQPGYLSYGPYIPLDPGRYSVTLLYSSPVSAKDSVGAFDISSATLGTIESVAISGSKDDLTRVEVHFEVASPDDVYEFRARWDGGGDLSIRSITLSGE